jgi:hypothetical protein
MAGGRRRTAGGVALVATIALAGCNRSGEPAEGSAVRTTNSAAQASSAGGRPALPGVRASFDPPAAWKVAHKPGPMRLATYVVPRADGDPEDG